MKAKLGLPPVPAPAIYDEGVLAAIKALAAGNASPGQQRDALNWIILRAAMYGEETFATGKPDLSDYLAGRRSVALQIMVLRDMPFSQLLKKETP